MYRREHGEATVRGMAGAGGDQARGRGTSREAGGGSQVKILTLEQYRTAQTVRTARQTEAAAYWAARTLIEALLAARMAAGAQKN